MNDRVLGLNVRSGGARGAEAQPWSRYWITDGSPNVTKSYHTIPSNCL